MSVICEIGGSAKYTASESLDPLKTTFFQEGFEAFVAALKSSPFSGYVATYKDPEDLKGKPDFILRNFVSGICTQLSVQSKYVFAQVSCHQSSEVSVTSSWITNVPPEDFEMVTKDVRDLFEWSSCEIDASFASSFVADDATLIGRRYLH